MGMPAQDSDTHGSIEKESQTIRGDPDHGGVTNFSNDAHGSA